MIDRLAGFQLQCLRKDAETVAANTAAAVAASAAATAAATGGPGAGAGAGGVAGSHWGHGLAGKKAQWVTRDAKRQWPERAGSVEGTIIHPQIPCTVFQRMRAYWGLLG